MKTHELKTWPVFYEKVIDGSKPFEVRNNDRNFKVDDILFLREYDPDAEDYTGRSCKVRVTYILGDNPFFQINNNVIMGIASLSTDESKGGNEKISIEIYNSGTEQFPFYQIMIDEEEYCSTNSKDKADKLVKMLQSSPLPVSEEPEKSAFQKAYEYPIAICTNCNHYEKGQCMIHAKSVSNNHSCNFFEYESQSLPVSEEKTAANKEKIIEICCKYFPVYYEKERSLSTIEWDNFISELYPAAQFRSETNEISDNDIYNQSHNTFFAYSENKELCKEIFIMGAKWYKSELSRRSNRKNER